MVSAEPLHPGFLELAVQHRYPLRHLDTFELPFCRLDEYLAKVQEGGGLMALQCKSTIISRSPMSSCSSTR